ncbi:hypothetical protein BDY19DRAFT_908095 [Irpex rosettiformis]|uniref:Uncharacterized protein n=1 Tax=Irpex rosettiformis TaxID=378272 RepID=A0ACB8TX92_9APHY|nr:hypothetical protein BDY19DRAFT_908095 [Irpex rosettiformis]
MPRKEDLLVVYNPVCGQSKAKVFFNDHVVPMLQGSGYDPDTLYETRHPGHAGEIIVDHLKKAHGPLNIVLGSGDGTLHEIVCALHDYAPDTQGQEINFALVPLGTANALYASIFPETAADLETDEVKLKSLHGFLTDPDFLPQSAFLQPKDFLTKDDFLPANAFIKKADFLTEKDFIQDDQRLSEKDFLPKEAFLTKDDLLKDEAFEITSEPLTKDAFLTEKDFIQDDRRLTKDDFLPKTAFLTKEDFLPKTAFPTKEDFIQDGRLLKDDDFLPKDVFDPKKSRYSPVRHLTLAKTTLLSKDGKKKEKTSISAVVTSTALHASILHDSEALRASHPGIERFKIAAQQNLTRWYHASVNLLPPKDSSVQIFDPSQNKFVPYQNPQQGGRATLQGPFAYFLSTVNVDRLEPAFRITSLFHSLPPDPDTNTLDVVIIRPLRDKSIREDSDYDRELFAKKSMAVLGAAYQDGKHVKLRYKDGEVVDDVEDGDVVVEYLRVGGWEWVPDEIDDAAHLVCADGEILQIDRHGKARCDALGSLDGYKLAVYT